MKLNNNEMNNEYHSSEDEERWECETPLLNVAAFGWIEGEVANFDFIFF
jgi:hypothetical protein